MRILHVDSSPKLKHSNSKQLSQFFIERVMEEYSDIEIDYLDLSEYSLPHVDNTFVQAMYKQESERDENMINHLKTSDNLCKRIMSADCVVFGIPMHNWCYPSVFKSFIDHITRVGITFQFDDSGNIVGNLREKKMLFITTRGADLMNDPKLSGMDALTPAIQSAFGFLGVKDMQFVNVQPLQFSDPEKHQLALNQAKIDLSSIATTWL